MHQIFDPIFNIQKQILTSSSITILFLSLQPEYIMQYSPDSKCQVWKKEVGQPSTGGLGLGMSENAGRDVNGTRTF